MRTIKSDYNAPRTSLYATYNCQTITFLFLYYSLPQYNTRKGRTLNADQSVYCLYCCVGSLVQEKDLYKLLGAYTVCFC